MTAAVSTSYGWILFDDETVSVKTILMGTVLLSTEYTFEIPLTAEQALAHRAVSSVTRTGLFDGPVMSDDGLRATFTRREGV